VCQPIAVIASPNVGPDIGGTLVVITGVKLTLGDFDSVQVTVGGEPAAIQSALDGELIIHTPAGTAGDIVVTTVHGETTLSAAFIHTTDCRVAHPEIGGGTGTALDPWLVYSTSHVDGFDTHQEDDFLVLRDLDFESAERTRFAGNIQGNFDGNSLTTSNLAIIGDSSTAMFGSVASTGRVHDLTLSNITVNGSSYTSSIAGRIHGRVERVDVTGQVNGNNTVGGVAGFMSAGGSLVDRVIDVDVTASESAGGALGQLLGRASNVHVLAR
jgi:hypothetical protein